MLREDEAEEEALPTTTFPVWAAAEVKGSAPVRLPEPASPVSPLRAADVEERPIADECLSLSFSLLVLLASLPPLSRSLLLFFLFIASPPSPDSLTLCGSLDFFLERLCL